MEVELQSTVLISAKGYLFHTRYSEKDRKGGRGKETPTSFC